jgi:ABC-type nitrate/sulfonate/bicarbonate transport system ATPase subunit
MQDELLRIWLETRKTVLLVTHDAHMAPPFFRRALII